ncbi:carboxypeptidase B-like [Macrobrachium rosenbergii]|uniref:carboxypeptidase B-like n=1 Tax=Macrobrachium rosenbergii TaxID=79674 RepID=UPI0034D5137A
MWVTLLALICGVAIAGADKGPQLWELDADAHHRVVRDLADEGHIDIWGHSRETTKVLVEPSLSHRVTRALSEAEISHSVVVPDVFELVEQERENMLLKKSRRKRAAGQMDWTSYHDLDDIEGFLGWLNVTGGNNVHIASASTTAEGRPVLVVRITNPNTTGPKKKIWIEGGIHAREWISPAVTTYLMHQVALSPEWKDLLDVTEWYFVPVANPDGYQFTFSSNRARLWRKNRRDNGGLIARCRGVDLNRNWSLKWGVGASSNPCSETYKGVEAFSEPETFGLQRMMNSIEDIDLFITFHSFGQTVLYPWGWTRDPPSNVKQLKGLAKKFANAVNEASGGQTEYELGGSGPLYGLASGATDDWAYGELGVPFSYTIELPDQGTYGFLLPASRISSTVTETAAGVYCMISSLTNTGRCARRRARNHSVNPRFQG